jgi:hypothetical protein
MSFGLIEIAASVAYFLELHLALMGCWNRIRWEALGQL